MTDTAAEIIKRGSTFAATLDDQKLKELQQQLKDDPERFKKGIEQARRIGKDFVSAMPGVDKGCAEVATDEIILGAARTLADAASASDFRERTEQNGRAAESIYNVCVVANGRGR